MTKKTQKVFQMALTQFKNLISDLQSFDFGAEQNRIINDTKDEVADSLKSQMASGKDGNGNDIRPAYSPMTIFLKKEHGIGLGAVTDRVTFYMTGAFYSGLNTRVSGSMFDFDSNVSYISKIIQRSGEKVLELSKANRMDYANDVLMPLFSQVLKLKTGLKIN